MTELWNNVNKITQIKAREILDSRGNPTLEVTAWANAASSSFGVPAGASTGSHEALEKRDGDPERWRGLGVLKAVENVNQKIAPVLIGTDPTDQKKIDAVLLQLDGTANKSSLGGNAIIGVSVACAKLAARVNNTEVFEHLRTLADIKPSRPAPYLYMNLINGGKHA
ncbi:MAG: phosphopyruvate hydratase, partial [Patescibacteria group bacterium]